LKDKIGSVIEGGDSGLYKILTGKDLLDERQIEYNLEAVAFPKRIGITVACRFNEYLEQNTELNDINEKMKEIREVLDNG
jgi:hypothetical protein